MRGTMADVSAFIISKFLPTYVGHVHILYGQLHDRYTSVRMCIFNCCCIGIAADWTMDGRYSTL